MWDNLVKRSISMTVASVTVSVLLWTTASGASAAELSPPHLSPAKAAPTAAPPAAPPAVPAPGGPLPEIPFASPDARGVLLPSSPGAWGGPRTADAATLSDRVVKYEIQATLDPVKHIVEGKERLTWRNRSDRPVDTVYLHMYLNAFEGNGSTFFRERNRPGFSFRSEVSIKEGQWGHIKLNSASQGGQDIKTSWAHPDGGPDTDHTVIRLDLPTPVAAGASTTLEMSFTDQLPRVIARTGYFGTFHLVGQWFPKIGVLELPGERGATAVRWNVHEFHLNSEFYADYGSFDVHMTVPKGFTVGATGEEIDPSVEANGMVTHHFVQDDVHEFAWTADSRSAKPLEGVYHGAGSPPVKVLVIYPPEVESNAAPVLKATIDSLAFFSQTLGPYPYRTVTAVIPPYNATEAGGMEYPTFFTTDSVPDPTPETLDAWALDFVTIHEFGHGYFYGILGSNEFEEPMLDEGMNEYWDERMLRGRDQDIHLSTRLSKRIGIDPVVSPFDFERVNAGLRHPAEGLGENSWNRLSSQSYGTVYSRTATTMHDLEERLGKPVLEKAMMDYYATWKFRHPSVADLQESLARSSGQRQIVEEAFATEVYAAKSLDDAVEDLQSVEVLPLPGTQWVDGKWVEKTEHEVDESIEKQRDDWKKAHAGKDAVGGPFPFLTTVTLRRYGVAVPEDLVVRFADGTSESVAWNDDGRNWVRYTWVKPVRALSAELDPKRTHLLDYDRLNNTRALEPEVPDSAGWTAHVRAALKSVFDGLVGGGPSRRWTADCAAVFQTVLTFVTTL